MEEVYNIDGRTILILNLVWEVEPWIIKTCRRLICTLCEEEKVAKSFPVIKFLIMEKSISNPTYYGEARISHPIYPEIVIYMETILKKVGNDSSLLELMLKQVILHELTHLFQEFKTKIISKDQQVAERLLRKITLPTEIESLADVRVWLRKDLGGLFYEGVARFCEHFYTGQIKFSQQSFERLYNNAKEEVSYLSKNIEGRFFLTYTSQKMVSSVAYEVGESMVYSTLFLNHEITIDDIIGMELFEFIKTYESCMLKRGYTPLVSLTSGAGVFDYKRVLAVLVRRTNEFKKRREEEFRWRENYMN